MALGQKYNPRWWAKMEAFAKRHGLSEDVTCELHDVICEALNEDSARWLGDDEMASKGGHARAKSLTPARRQEIARNAAQVRWNRKIAESDAMPSACAKSPSEATKAVDARTTDGEIADGRD